MLRMVVLAISALGFTACAIVESPREQLNDMAGLEAGAGQDSLPEGMVLVKGGCFEMGDDSVEGLSDEDLPHVTLVHVVCVGGFYMGKYEVTQRQWTEVMGNNPSYFKSCFECPVESVSWNDVQKFLDKLNRKDGKNYRLPTEAEWEYAARSRGKRARYPGTDNEGEFGDYGWYFDNSDMKTHPVGQKKPNELGLYDMSGNVWEWVQDWYGEDYYRTSPRDDPKGPESGEYRALRGAAWSCGLLSSRVSSRNYAPPDDWDSLRGFRFVRSK
ncbi:MAG: SUMF1/EgtB/PvdO family nonheme iron enzyme [Deltaproteobacteria bacterium]|nr:SUMF1/EgtB/PvdO family nonheme iron enzyme [Deltaproteobacteria bacterium]